MTEFLKPYSQREAAIRQIQFTGKPTWTDDVTTAVPMSTLNKLLGGKRLKEADESDIWESYRGPERSFFDDLPAFITEDGSPFILNIGDAKYLINTEGYNYCRYVSVILQDEAPAWETSKPPTELIEQIAEKHLDIKSLDTNNDDSRDFYERAVWQIKAALEAAYEAGKNSK